MTIYEGRKFSARSILWNITDKCNYKCNYCNAGNYIASNIDDIIQQLNELKGNNIVFLFGGEPTLHPQFNYILNSLKIPVGFYTNLHKDVSYLTNISKIICSFHNSFDTPINFSKKLQKLNEKGLSFSINVMLENDNMQTIYSYYKELLQKYGKHKVSLRLIIKDNYYTNDYMKYIKDLSYNYYKDKNVQIFTGDIFKQINTKGYLCDICKYMVILNGNNISPPCCSFTTLVTSLNTLERTICNKYCTYPQILIGTKRSLR